MPQDTNYILQEITKQLRQIKPKNQHTRVGQVLEVADGVAMVAGLDEIAMMEMVEFANGATGMAMNLEDGQTKVVILDRPTSVSEGEQVRQAGHVLSIPVSDELLGRVVNPLARAVDGGDKLPKGKLCPIDRDAPSVIMRQSVYQPLQTGLKAIDALTPIGRGQRQLIIGDRQTGKTAVAIDTIINQHDQDIICIYVAIGQKEAKVARLVEKLRQAGAMDYTIIVNSGASDPAALNYLAPFAGCAIAEYFMDQGKDVLIVYDDLSKHAVAYRQMSLILRRPPGREAYPGDVFYLHSRLLERAAKLSADYGGGSITALPIIETQAGEISAYIPTNVISITDGQIYLESDLFYRGVRPAINAGLSVSRVGSAAQTKAIKKVASKMRVSLAQYRDLESFAQFGSDLDADTKRYIERGQRAVEILKQAQYQPLAMARQAVIFYVLNNGYLDGVALERIAEYEQRLFAFLTNHFAKLMNSISDQKDLSADLEKELVRALEKFAKEF